MKFVKNAVLVALAGVASFGAVAADHTPSEESFQASIRLLAPIEITESKDLTFAPTLAGQDIQVVTSPEMPQAAMFNATGTPGEEVVASVKEASIEMKLDGVGATEAEKITVTDFTLGGGVDAAGNATFSAQGEINAVRVGATANVESNDVPGDYVGTATFQMKYL